MAPREEWGPIPREQVRDDFLETCNNPEMRVIEFQAELKPLYAVALHWDRDTGRPVRERTWWHGDKGQFYSLFHAVTGWVRRNQPELLDHYGLEASQ